MLLFLSVCQKPEDVPVQQNVGAMYYWHFICLCHVIQRLCNAFNGYLYM